MLSGSVNRRWPLPFLRTVREDAIAIEANVSLPSGFVSLSRTSAALGSDKGVGFFDAESLKVGRPRDQRLHGSCLVLGKLD